MTSSILTCRCNKCNSCFMLLVIEIDSLIAANVWRLCYMAIEQGHHMVAVGQLLSGLSV